ncbi:hypothetical protein Leryth_013742 [Lithospermum erythrorhizon]|nr:hypothetical protein Leryth_013742 [Lithospermum erythrorhizon]
MLTPKLKKAITDNPKKLADLIDLVNLPTTLREFMGQSQTSRLGCFKRVWSYIKENNLQACPSVTLAMYSAILWTKDPNNKNMVCCDEKLKGILLGKPRVDLAELPTLMKLHFPKKQKS